MSATASASRPRSTGPTHVTNHAIRRYLQRFDASDPYPRATLDACYRRAASGRPLPEHVDGPVVVVTADRGRGKAIVTVFRPNSGGNRVVAR